MSTPHLRRLLPCVESHHLASVELLHFFHSGLQSSPLLLQLSDSLLQLHKQTDIHGSLL